MKNNPMQVRKDSAIQTIKETFPFFIKDLRFHYGGVSFRHYMPALQKRLEFTIINYNLREEFDAIKNYFINVFNSKKIEIHATVQAVDGEPKLIEAHSPQIASINENLLTAVRFEFIKGLATKAIKAESIKTVLTMDEFIEILTEKEVNAFAFYENEQELTEDVLKITNAKHYNHLRFLSAKHAYRVMRLRFILKPFSFLFLIEGEKHYHLVWETLDTEEATYMWLVDKDRNRLKAALEKTGEIITNIKVQGKKAYISSSEDRYNRVLHNYERGIEGFIKWRDELESYLT